MSNVECRIANWVFASIQSLLGGFYPPRCRSSLTAERNRWVEAPAPLLSLARFYASLGVVANGRDDPPYCVVTLIFRVLADGALGNVTVSTPSLSTALTPSASTSVSSVRWRVNSP